MLRYETTKIQFKLQHTGSNSFTCEKHMWKEIHSSFVLAVETNCVFSLLFSVEHDNAGFAPGWFLDKVSISW